MLKKIIKSIINKYGYNIQKKVLLGYDYEEEALEQIDIIRKNTMLPSIRLISLYQQVVFCEKNETDGCFVECGTWKGGAVGLMALGNQNYGKKRRHIHLFDAFQDICEPDETMDGEKAIKETKKWSSGKKSGKLRPLTGFYDSIGGPGTLEENIILLEQTIGYDPQYIHYHEGWFQDTLPNDAGEISDIAILRLDGDWYESTKICLDFLYDKVVSGGFVIVDDYGHYEGCKKAIDEFIQKNNLKVFLNHIDYTCIYWIKP